MRNSLKLVNSDLYWKIKDIAHEVIDNGFTYDKQEKDSNQELASLLLKEVKQKTRLYLDKKHVNIFLIIIFIYYFYSIRDQIMLEFTLTQMITDQIV